MLCEHYKNALVEAAATGSEPQETLRAHLAGCAPCRASFAAEQQLFAAIDAGLHVSANAEVPASLLPCVRARLDEEAAPHRGWVSSWVAIAATAALILILISVRSRRSNPAGQNPQNSTVAQTVSSAEIPEAAIGAPPETNSGHRMNKHHAPPRVEISAAVEQISVLLPAGQKEAIDSWLAGFQRGKVKADDLLAKNPDLPLQDLQIAPLDVSPIKMDPLTSVSRESPSKSEETKR